MLRKLLNGSGIVLVALIALLLLVASPPGFMTPLIQPVRMLLVAVATNAVSRSLNGTLEVGAVEGSLLSAPIARSISLKGAQGEEIIYLDTLRLRYGLADLFLGRLRIQELAIEEPRLRLAWDEQGQSNLSDLFPPGPTDAGTVASDTGLPTSILLERVSVRSGAVTLEHASFPGAREVDDLNLDLSGEMGEGGFRLEVQSAVAQVNPAAVSLEALRGVLSMTGKRMQLDGWLLHTGASRIRLQGVVPAGGEPASLRLELAGLDLGEFGRLIGEQSLRGEVRGLAQAEGPADALELNGRFTVGAGEIVISGGLETGDAIPHYRGEVQLSNLDLSALVGRDGYGSDINAKLRIQGSGGSLEDLSGELDLLIKSSRVGDLAIQPSQVRITAGSERIRVQRFQVQTTAFTAAVEGEVDFAGRSALDYRMTTDIGKLRGLIDANDLVGKGRLSGRVGGAWPDTYIEGDLELRDFVIDDSGVRGLDLNYRIDGLEGGPRLAAKLDVRAARIGVGRVEAATSDVEYAFDDNKHQVQFAAHLTQSASVETTLDGAIVSDGQHSELTLTHIRARLDDQVWLNTTPVRFAFAPDGFLIEPFRLAHGDASVTSSGGLHGGRFKDLVFTASNIDLTFLGRSAAMPILEHSRGDLAVDLGGTLDAPMLNLDLTLRRENDQSQNPPFEQAGLRLSCALDSLEGEAYIEQDARRVLTAGLALPVNLALNGTPIEQRLDDAPLSANLVIDRPALEALSAIASNVPALSGTLRGRIDIAGTYTDLAVDSHLHTLANFAGMPDTELSLAASLRKDRLQFERILATTGASEIRGEGGFSLNDKNIAFQWRIPRLDLREFIADLPRNIPPLVSGRMDIKGSIQDAKFSSQLEYAGAALVADIKLGLGDVPPSYQADLSISDLDLDRFEPELQGTLTASATIQGVGLNEEDRKARITTTIDSKDLVLAPELTGRVQADVRGRALEVEDLRLQSKGFEISARGALSDTQPSDFDYRFIARDLSSFHGYVPGDLQVRGTLDGKISGDRDSLNTVTTLRVEKWHYADWQGGKVAAKLKINDLLAARQATASVEVVDLQGSQLANTNLQFDGTYRSDQGDFALAVTEGPFAQSLISGQVTTEQGVQVRLEPFRLQHGDWVWKNTAPIQIVSGATGAVTVKELNLVSVDQRLSARGTWSPGETITAEVRVDGLRLRPILNVLAFDVEELDGLLDADIAIKGRVAQPLVEATLQTTALRWRQRDLGEISAQIGTAGPVLKGRAQWLDQQKELLSLDGRIDRGASNTIVADVLAPDLDLSMLQALSREVVHSDGRLRLDLALSGTLSQPQARGILELRDGELQLAALGEKHTDIQGRLVFNGTRMEIEQLQANSRTGKAEIHGWIESAGLALGQADLVFSTDNFTFLDTPALAAVVSSNVELRGSGQDLMTTGELEVVRARLRYDALPSTGPSTVEPWELTVDGVFGAGEQEAAIGIGKQPGRGALPLLPFLRTDIQVNMPGNSWVRGNGTAIEIAGDVRVKKALEYPFNMAGTIRTLRGFATFFGNRFIVEKGQISFTGSEEIDPFLDVEASHQVSGYKAYVSITGTASKPEVSFRSEPELAESDVISLLIFGRTSDQLSSAERTSLSNQARRLAGQLAAGALERRVGKSLGLDSIAVDLGDDTTKTSVGVGRYISQDVFLFYERTFRDPRRGNRSGNTVGIEKRLNERQTLKATGSDLGETAVDWLWRHDY